MMPQPIRTLLWLKCFGTHRQDGWWQIKCKFVTTSLMRSVIWEFSKEEWSRSACNDLNLLTDWSGSLYDICEDDNTIINALDSIGACLGYTGWPKFQNLTEDDKMWLITHLPQYKKMIA